MKQVLNYLNPNKKFDEESSRAIKIQIENSFRLGWKKEDILLVTNFNYKYLGVKSIIVGDENYYEPFKPANKIYALVALFNKGLEKDLYWYHDLDCFQLNPLIKPDLGEADIGVTQYGRMPRLCSASIFFKETAKDMFQHLKEEIAKRKMGEEEGLMRLKNIEPEYVNRIKLLNLSYALHKFNFWHVYCRAIKPIQATHFHLTPDKYDFYVRGNNRPNLKIIPKGLVEIFHKHEFDK